MGQKKTLLLLFFVTLLAQSRGRNAEKVRNMTSSIIK